MAKSLPPRPKAKPGKPISMKKYEDSAYDKAKDKMELKKINKKRK